MPRGERENMKLKELNLNSKEIETLGIRIWYHCIYCGEMFKEISKIEHHGPNCPMREVDKSE